MSKFDNISKGEWKDIEGFEGLYKVSSFGMVKSLRNKKILSLRIYNGYVYVSMTDSKKYKRMKRVHRLVAKAFISNPKNLPQVNHLDGVKINNHVANLEWPNASLNMVHAYENGLMVSVKGEAHGSAKLSNGQVLDIRELGKTKSVKEMSKIYGVVLTTIVNIINRKTWKHI